MDSMADAVYRVRLGQGGRLVLPAKLRREMGVDVGSELLLMETREGEWRLFTRSAALDQMRALVRRHVEPGDSLVDELLAERRREQNRRG